MIIAKREHFWMELTKDKLGGRFFFNGQQAVRLLDGKRK